MATRLRRGKVSIEGHIDLHGLCQEDAHHALSAFLAAAQANARRCVLVITGKGNRGSGVLRTMVPRWLNEAPNRQRVIAFSYAQPRDGGEGALYVVVRKP